MSHAEQSCSVSSVGSKKCLNGRAGLGIRLNLFAFLQPKRPSHWVLAVSVQGVKIVLSIEPCLVCTMPLWACWRSLPSNKQSVFRFIKHLTLYLGWTLRNSLFTDELGNPDTAIMPELFQFYDMPSCSLLQLGLLWHKTTSLTSHSLLTSHKP